jgi:8-oxo-dGTP pyrophosphatase MutT (NUDIX family)
VPEPIYQAGAVTFRLNAGAPEFLLVRSKKNPQHWVFPKGHIEPGESSEAAAVRELREEAGINGEIVEPLGILQFQSGSEYVRVQYYLCRFRKQIDDGEGRERQWCLPEDAREFISFEDARDLLAKAVEKLRHHRRL